MVADQKHKIEDAHELLLQALEDKQTCDRTLNLSNALISDLIKIRSWLQNLEPKCDLRHVPLHPPPTPPPTPLVFSLFQLYLPSPMQLHPSETRL